MAFFIQTGVLHVSFQDATIRKGVKLFLHFTEHNRHSAGTD
jgi:hypothetical protein